MPNCQTCGTANTLPQGTCRICRMPYGHPPSAADANASSSEDVTPPAAAPSVNSLKPKARNLGTQRALWLAAWGAIGGGLGSLIAEITQPDRQTTVLFTLVLSGAWFAIITSLIAFAISAGQLAYLKQKPLQASSIAAGLFGAGAGFLGGAVAQAAYSIIGTNSLVQILCWGAAAALVGVGLSFRIPNLGKLRGFIGGAIGGVAGCFMFDVVSLVAAPVLGRSVGCASIGFMIGLMIVASESLFREAWLEIQYGPHERRTISLGNHPVCIGSDSSACAIFTRGVAPIARRYTLKDRVIYCEDLTTGKPSTLKPGDTEAIGNLTVVVHGS